MLLAVRMRCGACAQFTRRYTVWMAQPTCGYAQEIVPIAIENKLLLLREYVARKPIDASLP